LRLVGRKFDAGGTRVDGQNVHIALYKKVSCSGSFGGLNGGFNA
jgi:hypothetical protein